MAERLPALQRFIDILRDVWSRQSDQGVRMNLAKGFLETLLADEEFYRQSKSWPVTDGGQRLCLYEDPDHGFAIVVAVRQPGRRGHAHDHGEAWIL